MFLVDSHCHLDMLDQSTQGSVADILKRAREQDVKFFLNVSVSLKTFPNVLKIAEAYPFVAASVGLHPNEQEEEVDLPTLVELAKSSKVIAIGETGLDYYRSQGDVDWQRARFRTHIGAAKEVKKPLIIHTRQAKADTLAILQEEKAEEVRGVMHCFTEDWEMAKKALDLGFFISFSGIVTFKNATTIQEVAKKVPLDRLLIETDAPYLAPDPNRGKANEPAFLRHTALYLASLRQISLDELGEASSHNFFILFKGAKQDHV